MKRVTRAGIHIDRAACAWLIRRTIDADAETDATPLDMRGVELGHHGGDCSFETILRRHDITDPVLWRIAEIIHEADIDDERYDAPEARPRRDPPRPLHDRRRRAHPRRHETPLRQPLRVLPPRRSRRPRTSLTSEA